MLSEKKIQKFRQALEILKSDLESAIALAADASKPVELDQSTLGRVSRGDALQQQAVCKATRAKKCAQLRRVNDALHRLSEDEYAYCLSCGEDIAEARLEVMPDSEYCIDCCRNMEMRP